MSNQEEREAEITEVSRAEEIDDEVAMAGEVIASSVSYVRSGVNSTIEQQENAAKSKTSKSAPVSTRVDVLAISAKPRAILTPYKTCVAQHSLGSLLNDIATASHTDRDAIVVPLLVAASAAVGLGIRIETGEGRHVSCDLHAALVGSEPNEYPFLLAMSEVQVAEDVAASRLQKSEALALQKAKATTRARMNAELVGLRVEEQGSEHVAPGVFRGRILCHSSAARQVMRHLAATQDGLLLAPERGLPLLGWPDQMKVGQDQVPQALLAAFNRLPLRLVSDGKSSSAYRSVSSIGHVALNEIEEIAIAAPAKVGMLLWQATVPLDHHLSLPTDNEDVAESDESTSFAEAPETSVGEFAKVDPPSLVAVLMKLRDLAILSPGRDLQLAPKSIPKFKNFSENQVKFKSMHSEQPMRGIYEYAPLLTLKIAGVLHVLKWATGHVRSLSSTVEMETINQAIAVVEATQLNAVKLFEAVSHPQPIRDLRRLREYLAIHHGSRQFDERKLQRSIGYTLPGERLATSLDRLIDLGQLKVLSQNRGNRQFEFKS